MLNYFQGYADHYSISMDELLSNEGFASVDDLINGKYESIMQGSVNMLVMLAIAEDAGITVSGDDVTNYFIQNKLASDYDSIVERYGMPYIKYEVLCQKVLDFVIDNAVLL